MESDKKYIYVKFAIDSKTQLMNGMKVSEERQVVEQWSGPSRRGTNAESNKSGDGEAKEELRKAPGSFKKVILDFDQSAETFRRSVPFVMGSLPLMRRFSDDDTLRKFVVRNGEQIDTGAFETFRLDSKYWADFSRRIQSSGAIANGVSRLPSLFLLGLVSSYDVFLSKLIKAMFEVRPELLFTSDRSVSFKDILESGSIDDVRTNIVDREIDSVIRSSHADQIDWFEKRLSIPLRKDLKFGRILLRFVKGEIFSHTPTVWSLDNI